MYKQVIVVRSDLKMSRGKLIAQCCHASVSVLNKINKKILDIWEKSGQKKIVVKVKNIDEMIKLKNKCNKLNIPYSIISDAGLTELTPGTITVMGIGPEEEKKIDKVTGSLPLLK
ncbi:MAG: peptidyl-tRNA hydrolase Pth2 [Candidatus Aenigmatarchaeota archaeon]